MTRALSLLLISAAAQASTWLPEAAATARAERVDAHFLFLMLLAGSVFFLLLFAVDLLLFANLRQAPDQVGSSRPNSVWHASLVGAGALLLALALFVAGARAYLDQRVAPIGTETIEAMIGEDGRWVFQYSGDVATDTLHVAVQQPTQLLLRAAEEPLTLTIPAFRLRQMALPGAPVATWFSASEPGRYFIVGEQARAEGNKGLQSWAVVHEADGFAAWLASKSDILLSLPPPEAGRVLANRNGCFACHSVDGSKLTGPTFSDLVGRQEELTDGTTVIADADYIRRSILDPASQVVAGFPPIMPSFQGKIRDQEIDAIYQYFQSISDTQEAR
jgi:cytochrome c oxidase subunit 2